MNLPEVIALRERLYPGRAGYHRVAASVTNPAWLEAIPGDTPALVVAEGLLMYLREPEVVALMRRVTERFPSGQVAFDGYSGAMVRLVSRLATVRGAKVGLGRGRPARPRAAGATGWPESVSTLTMPDLVRRLARGAVSRAAYAALGRLPFYRNLVRHLGCVFPAPR